MGRTSLESWSIITCSCLLFTAACSSGGSEEAGADAPALPQSTPDMAIQPAAPSPMAEPAAALPSGSSNTEGAPVGAGLTPPPAPGASTAGGMEPGGAAPSGPGAPAAVEAGAPRPSAGCGAGSAAMSGRFTIDVAGTPRDYILELPEDYDATRPYRLVFTWHPGGGSAQGTANNVYGLRPNAAGSAIFVSPEGIDQGWANTGGRDLAFLDAMLEQFQGQLCFDQSRVFSTGFSYGGMMSFAIACARADVFRAIAPMSGALFSGCADGDTPIAMFGFHGTSDTVVDISAGVRARDVVVERNGCQPESAAVSTDGCLAFQGCSAGHPVTWCEFAGGHTPAPQSGQRIWEFFDQF